MFNVLVLCTHNSARSILAEVLLNHYGKGILQAYSAGSAPRFNQQPHPIGLAVLCEHGHSITGLSSKSWDIFTATDSPVSQLDLVITVCDSAAGESCPLFVGSPHKIHWGYADPSAGTGGDVSKQANFELIYAAMSRRIQALVALAKSAKNSTDLHAAALAVVHIT
jgi:protein-tyrosine-phosphatase